MLQLKNDQLGVGPFIIDLHSLQQTATTTSPEMFFYKKWPSDRAHAAEALCRVDGWSACKSPPALITREGDHNGEVTQGNYPIPVYSH